VPPDFIVPDVNTLLPAGARVETGTEQLRSEYFDTADRALLRAQTTLRRRTGSTDNGWQLKIPHAPFREEIRVGLEEQMPEQLRLLLLGVTRGQALIQIASVSTERSVTRLLDSFGRHLAEIDDDTVHASAAGDSATASSWREVEVELVDGEPDLLYALAERLGRAGAHSSDSPSKLARALPTAPATAAGELRSGEVVADYITEQQRSILAGDLALRRGDDGVIHKTRVATRRLRGTLRVYGALFDDERAATLDSELRWYAALLGAVRDRQVLQKRLATMLDHLEDTLQLGPVRTRIETELRHEQTEHWPILLHEISGDRYLALLGDLDAWVQQPPWTAKADAPAPALSRALRRAERTVSRRLQRANATGDIQRLHGARKAAKRARYAAETARPVIGDKAAAKHAHRYEKLQDLLGEHQDSLLSAELLRRLGAKAGNTAGENGFAFGILHEREEQNARAARAKARKTAKKYR
jgi:CHAD domain-containing protein